MSVSYLVAVYSVLGRPGGDRDGIRLAAAVALTVSILTSLPEHTHKHMIRMKSFVLITGNHTYFQGEKRKENTH